jgi:hypothetical protein
MTEGWYSLLQISGKTEHYTVLHYIRLTIRPAAHINNYLDSSTFKANHSYSPTRQDSLPTILYTDALYHVLVVLGLYSSA